MHNSEGKNKICIYRDLYQETRTRENSSLNLPQKHCFNNTWTKLFYEYSRIQSRSFSPQTQLRLAALKQIRKNFRITLAAPTAAGTVQGQDKSSQTAISIRGQREQNICPTSRPYGELPERQFLSPPHPECSRNWHHSVPGTPKNKRKRMGNLLRSSQTLTETGKRLIPEAFLTRRREEQSVSSKS